MPNSLGLSNTIMLCIVMLILFTVINIFTAKWIAKSILPLNTATKNIPKCESEQTDRQQSEKILSDYNRTLEAEVVEHTIELARTNDKLQNEIINRELLEGKLDSSTQQISAIFESIADIVIIIDEQKNLQIIPTKATSLYAYDMNEFYLIVRGFFQAETEYIWFAKIQQALETQQTVNFDYSLWINHQEIWFAANISPLQNRSVVWVAREISDRKQAEETLQDSIEREQAITRSMVILV